MNSNLSSSRASSSSIIQLQSISSTPRPESLRVESSGDDGARHRIMVKHLYKNVCSNRWIDSKTNSHHDCSAVLLRHHGKQYICQPDHVAEPLLQAVQGLNVEVAFTMQNATISAVISALDPAQTNILLRDGSQIQVLQSLNQIQTETQTTVKRYQYAALIRDEEMLLVWHDDVDLIMPCAKAIESRLLALIWGDQSTIFKLVDSNMKPNIPNEDSSDATFFDASYTKEKSKPVEYVYEVAEDYDEESATSPESVDRPHILTSSVMVGCGLFLIIVLMLGFGLSTMIYEYLEDRDPIRFALLIFLPASFALSLFFVIVIFGNFFQAIGPISSLLTNSRYNSPQKPNLERAFREGMTLPLITIQMPVYKEGLEAVIKPTIDSLKIAIAHYESRGGTAKIVINDDGMACISKEDAEKRRSFYRSNNIGWVARPMHGETFIRKGKFKKASNMNFALNLAVKIETAILTKLQEKNLDLIDSKTEQQIYKQSLAKILEENPHAQAEGDIRIGDIILIIDSDTRVPVDCLQYGAAEMFLSPEVAILQHSTGVMQVSWDYFENGITYFTNLIYTSIRFATGSGETAPFVGHNAFLRWQAIQSVSKADEDGYIAFWSESHVSEDFDMSLRLQVANNIVRLASYHNGEFKEGVSLTIYDELARWEKYAFGCNELVFNPIYTWLWKGPFTKLFRTFLTSNYPPSSKITVIGYISSYYAIAAAFPLTLANYFLIGWFNGYLDKYYLESWKLFLSLIFVFNILSTITLAIVRARTGEKNILSSIIENMKWMPMFAIFFGGLSFHLSMAILSHMLGINMQWGATNKEKENSNFFKEVPKILNTFKWLFVTMTICIIAMIYFGCFAPRGWDIKGVTAITPLAISVVSHIIMPFVLNPSLMVFHY